MPRFSKSLAVSAAAAVLLMLAACGSSVESAKKFYPNKPPVIGAVTAFIASTGAAVTKDTRLTSGMEIAVTVPGYDPEGKTLAWSADSEYGYPRDEKVTANGYSFTFVVQDITADTEAPVRILAVDEKRAGAGTTFFAGTGLQPATVTLSAAGDTTVSPSDTVTLAFTTDHDGYFETFIDNTAAAVTAMRSAKRTVCGPGAAKEFTVKGPSSTAAAELTLAAGVNRIWAAFIDTNGTVSSAYCEITVDADAPQLLSSNPADGAAGAAQAPVIELVFSKTMDAASLAGAVTVSGNGIGQTASVTSCSGPSAVFTVADGFPLLTRCTVTVKGAKDTLGNTMIPASFSFTTASGPVVSYMANGGTGEPPAGETHAEGDTVTVAGQGTLSRAGYTFAGWNTAADGSGTAYAAGDKFTMSADDVVLYAQWTKITPTGISFSPTWMSLLPGHSEKLTVTLEPAGASEEDITWSYTTQDIASVSKDSDGDFIITGESVGATSVKAAVNGVTASCAVTVSLPKIPQSLTMSLGTNYTMPVAIAWRKSMIYTSSNPEIASCTYSPGGQTSDNLIITAKKAGSTTISAYREGMLWYFPVTVTTVKTMAAGGAHTLIIRSDWTLWTCGSNVSGQLGTSDNAVRKSPTRITSVSDGSLGPVKSVAAGENHSIVITAEGSVYTCGSSTDGQLGTGLNTTPELTRITSVTNGSSFSPDAMISAAAGLQHSCLVTASGKLYTFGNGLNGRLGLDDNAQRSIPTSVTTLSDGGTLGRVAAAAAGGSHTLILDTDGRLYSCGSGSTYQLGCNVTSDSMKPTLIGSIADITAASAGSEHSLALTSAGVLYAFGRNHCGQLGIGSLLNQPTPAAVGKVYEYGASETATIGPVQSMSAGNNHSLIITRSGKAYGCGFNDQGQLGSAVSSDYFIFPTEIRYVSNKDSSTRDIRGSAAAVRTGNNYSLILTTDGRLYGCGYNNYGQLGQGDVNNHTTPVEIVLPAEVQW